MNLEKSTMTTLQNDGSFEHECYLCAEKFHDVINATNHLKSSHDKKDGESLRCMNSQTSGMFCSVNCKSMKALRNHMKQKKCKLLSRETTFI